MSENDLETRVERLETAVTSIKVDLEVIKATMATKSDIANMATKSDLVELKTAIADLRAETKSAIAESKNSMILWVVSAVILSQLLPSLLTYFR